MEIAMLVIAIVSTLIALVSLIYTICVKKEISTIKQQIRIFVSADLDKNNDVKTNSGIVANDIAGGINFHGK